MDASTSVTQRPEGKNIVVCLDGTNNQYGHHNSNVARLYETLDLTDPGRQVAYYDPGVGTFSAWPVIGKPTRFVMRALGMAFGLGLTANLKEAYRYLMRTYEKGDRIYVFGFSRGAYTARALAGWMNMCGLLRRDNDNLVDYSLRIYKSADFDLAYGDDDEELVGFKKVFAHRDCDVHFLGLWDTVSSVGRVYNPVFFPYTDTLYSVDHVRHAISIDERRGFYRDLPVNKVAKRATLKEVWFAGVHSDVGGSYDRGENHLGRIPLEWMLVEAEQLCLRVDRTKALEATRTERPLVEPAYRVHRSLKGPWHLAELIPKKVWSREADQRKLRVNLWRSRTIPDGAHVHESVTAKQEDDPSYKPLNLPEVYQLAEWSRYGAGPASSSASSSAPAMTR